MQKFVDARSMSISNVVKIKQRSLKEKKKKMVMKVTFVHLDLDQTQKLEFLATRTFKNYQSQITMKLKVWMKDCYRNKR